MMFTHTHTHAIIVAISNTFIPSTSLLVELRPHIKFQNKQAIVTYRLKAISLNKVQVSNEQS